MRVILVSDIATLNVLRKLKDTDGNYCWQPGASGEPDTFLGCEVKLA